MKRKTRMELLAELSKHILKHRNVIRSGENSRFLADYKLSPIDTLNLSERIRMTPTLLRNLFYIKNSVKISRDNPKRTSITDEELVQFKKYAISLGIANIGFTKIYPDDIFNGFGVKYPFAIVFTFPMPKKDIISDPCFTKLKMIESTFADSGMLALRLTKYLKNRYFGAQPGPGGGRLAILPVLAKRAGLGVFGRHGVLISKDFGPAARIGLIYTNINNLPSTNNNNDDMAWVKEFCAICGSCIKKCPYNAIYEVPVVTTAKNLKHVDVKKCIKQFETKYGCTLCLKVCTFTNVEYVKIQKKFIRKRLKLQLNYAISGEQNGN